MSRDNPKFWTRETEADFLLPDGHKMRVALEIRKPEWVGFRPKVSDPRLPASEWDGVPESRLILMHDDWPDREKRLRTFRTWQHQVDFDANHVHGLAWLIDQLAERQEELPSLLCSEFAVAFENLIEGVFSDCAFFLPDGEGAEFPEYVEIYLEPALNWLLESTPENFDSLPMIRE